MKKDIGNNIGIRVFAQAWSFAILFLAALLFAPFNSSNIQAATLAIDTFDDELFGSGIPAGRKGFILRSQEARLRKSPLGLCQYDIRRNEPVVASAISFEQGYDGAD